MWVPSDLAGWTHIFERLNCIATTDSGKMLALSPSWIDAYFHCFPPARGL